ncbi:MAG TPA: phage integrase N-terminal SAM-like domain-containing protein [Terrimicrobiaceae bacterium]
MSECGGNCAYAITPCDPSRVICNGWSGFWPITEANRGLDGDSEAKVRDFLEYLALGRNVSANTQNQAFSALLFLYTHVAQAARGGRREEPTGINKRRLGQLCGRRIPDCRRLASRRQRRCRGDYSGDQACWFL